MDTIMDYFRSFGLDWQALLTAGGVFLVGLLVLGGISRFIFGRKATLTAAVSSAIGILFIYALTVVIRVFLPEWSWLAAQLPYVTFTEDCLFVFDFYADYTVICQQVLSMVVLAFLMNLADRWMPPKKKLFGWLLSRILAVVLGFAMHALVTYLFAAYLPNELTAYAPAVLLGLLLLMLLTGALKFPVGLVAATVNPIIGGLYTFFFANTVGKMITRAVLTTGLLTLIVFALRHMGILVFSICGGALYAYIPFLIALAALWFLIGHIF